MTNRWIKASAKHPECERRCLWQTVNGERHLVHGELHSRGVHQLPPVAGAYGRVLELRHHAQRGQEVLDRGVQPREGIPRPRLQGETPGRGGGSEQVPGTPHESAERRANPHSHTFNLLLEDQTTQNTSLEGTCTCIVCVSCFLQRRFFRENPSRHKITSIGAVLLLNKQT